MTDGSAPYTGVAHRLPQVRLKYVLHERDERLGESDAELLALSKQAGVLPRSELGDSVAVADSLARYKRVGPSEIVMNKMQAWNGAFAVSAYDGVVSPDYTVLSLSGLPSETRYIEYVLRSRQFAEACAGVARGMGTAFLRVNTSDLLSLRIPFPDYAAQRTIADYLDRETARIDALIAAKRRMAELLEERWLQTIHEATRGADVPGPRRETGLDWLGSVPSTWEVMRLTRLARVRRGASPRPIDDPIYFDPDGEFAWVRISDVSASDTYLERTTQRLSSVGSSLSVKLMPGELFLSIAGTVGKPIITRIKCCIHDGFVYFVGLRLNPKYLYYLFAAGRLYLGLGKLGTQLNLNTDTVGAIRVPVPEPVEQERIVARLDRSAAHFAALRGALSRQLGLLQEHRVAVVTTSIYRPNEIPDAE